MLAGKKSSGREKIDLREQQLPVSYRVVVEKAAHNLFTNTVLFNVSLPAVDRDFLLKKNESLKERRAAKK